MTWWTCSVTVMPRPSVNDPQGLAVLDGLHSMGFNQDSLVRVGRHIQTMVDAESEEEALKLTEEMCHKLLANTLIETYAVEVRHADIT